MNASDHDVVQNRGEIMHPHLPYTDAPHKRNNLHCVPKKTGPPNSWW